MSAVFTRNQFAFRTVSFHRQIALSVALGVATAAAVITGALIVGDSMRGSLRALTIDRLGRVDQMILPGGFFNASGMDTNLQGRDIAAVILFDQGVVETGTRDEDGKIRRASSIQVIGIDSSFRLLDSVNVIPEVGPGLDEVFLNQAAADELGVQVGDQVTVRLPSEQAVPADSPLGKRDSQTEGIPRLTIKAIVANRGLGRFALRPSQVEPMTILMNREAIANALDRSGQANALLVSLPGGADTSKIDATTWRDSLPFRLSDVGIKASRVTRKFKEQGDSETTVFDYYQVTSDRLLLPKSAAEKLIKDFHDDGAVEVMTYLANAIDRIDAGNNSLASVPYSIITAMDSSETMPLEFREDENDASIVLNDWTANALQAAVGDRIRFFYYEPEVDSGREVEKSFDAILSQIAPITTPSKPYRRNRPNEFESIPTVYNDPDMTPSVPGVTDQNSISDWDLPFKLERTISNEDDKYWADHRLTPKAFITLNVGKKFFGSRFGDVTSIRFPVAFAKDVEAFENRMIASLKPEWDQLGWQPIMIRDKQLAASKGTTPFDALFLSLSMFVILAAVLLISLLYRLGMLKRSKDYGLLMATGWTGKDVTRLAIREGVWSSLPGVALGLLGGVVYSMLVLGALKSWWVGAVTVRFLEFHASTISFIIGGVSSLSVAMLTIWVTTRRLRKVTAQSLLSGNIENDDVHHLPTGTKGRTAKVVAAILLISAIVMLVAGVGGSGLSQAGAFVGAGMLLLFASLAFIHQRLSVPPSRDRPADWNYTLLKMATGNLRRNPLRSTLAIGLMSVATFLIISIGAFELRPTVSGTGGFSLLGKTATPIFRDLRDRSVQTEWLGRDAETFPEAEVMPFRFKSGQDASCNNLYQAEQPQVLGVPEAMAVKRDQTPFDWAAVAIDDDHPSGTIPWGLLSIPASGTRNDPIPLIVDQNTAMWALQMTSGIGEVRSFAWTPDRPFYFKVVALLSNSVLQGSLLVGESNFEKIFPEVSGYQFFMIATNEPERVEQAFENRMGDVGMDITRSDIVLSRLMAVQNTYLKTFQSLGGLGLLLGTIGLAIAQLRSAVERQGELAVMRAIGFSRPRLARGIMLESATLLLIGIGCGIFCAMITVAPHAITGQALPPVAQPIIAILGIAIVGLIAGVVAVVKVVQMPLIESLRS